METVLKVRGLSKYFGKKKVVDNIDLDVYSGEVLGFLGPNGAGKTTAIKMIMGFLTKDNGTIEICGFDVEKNYEEAMSVVGGIVENPDMYKQFSGMLNLTMYARAHGGIPETRIREIVQMVGLQNRINDKVKKYSLGMKQRLGLAMALVHSPKLLILDEPTNGLDPAGIKELRDILKNVAKEENAAVLVSSHQLAEMELMCDRVAIISNGQILCEKTVEELSKTGSESIYRFSVDNVDNALELLEESAEIFSEGVIAVKIEKLSVPSVVKKLTDAGVGIYEITKEENSLEDAFIEITGGGISIA